MTSTLEPQTSDPTQSARAAEPAGPVFVATGASQTRAKRIGDREKTAARLLRSSIERSYDAEVDIDWDEPWAEGKTFGPEHRLSLYGTRMWDKLTPEQRNELNRHEMASVLSFGILAEQGLNMALGRGVLLGNLADDTTRYLLTEIGDETRHSVMFSRAINKLGVKPYTYPKSLVRVFLPLAMAIPDGPSSFAGLLLVEELLDRLQREAVLDEGMQPHLRQLMKIHILEEARHITFAREELVRSYNAASRFSKAFHRGVIAIAAFGIYPALLNPQIYRRALGMSPLRGLLIALLNPNYRANATFASEALLRFFHEGGMVTGWFTTRVLRASRALPDDIHEEVFGKPPTHKTSWFNRVLARAVGV